MDQQRALEMSSLDGIWDEPVSPSHPPTTRADDDSPRPAKRPRQALFLADSDDDNDDLEPTRGPVYRPPPQQNIDVDALFAGLEEEDDDPFTFKPLGPELDEEEIRRQAMARHKPSLPSLTPHQILPSSSPARENDRDGAAEGGKKDDGKGEKKGRRKPVRLDEGRLLGENGFPKLIQQTKDFRIKGKGHEATDLNRLLQVYQFWTHSMYPKTQFRDTIERVEKLCHSKRMHVALSVWRDEAHGKKHVTDDEDEDVVDFARKTPEADKSTDKVPGSTTEAQNSDDVEYATSSPAGSRPPTSASEFENDDFDIDAIIRDEEERRTKERAPEVEKQKETSQNVDEDEDETMWSMFNDDPSELPQSASTGVTAVPRAQVAMEEDEDIWAVVDDIERESAKPTEMLAAISKSTVGASLSEPTAKVSVPVGAGDDDEEEDWDSMYL